MAERHVGLDIGTSAIRAVEAVVGEGDRPVVENYGQVGIPPGTVVDGEVRDHARVTRAIQHLWRDGGFRYRKVMIGVAGLRAITREIDMVPVPPDELDDAARFQADQVIPFNIEDTYMSSKVIAQFTDAEGNPQIRVLVAAAHREMIDSVVKAVEDAGLEPVGIDLNTAALARALVDPGAGGRAEAIVSVGAGLTLVVVHQSGLLQFIRTIDLGGNAVTQAVAGALDLPETDAEAVKRRLGEPGYHDARAESSVASAVDELVGEIHNSIRFYSSLPGRGAPARLLVTGAGARTVGFFPKLQQGLDIPVVPASPLSMVDNRLPITAEQAAIINPTIAVPVGLAMTDPATRPFNLLPSVVTAKYAEQRIRRYLVMAGVAVLFLLLVGTASRILAVHNAQDNVSRLTAQLTTITKVTIPKYNASVTLADNVKTLQTRLKPLVATEINWLIAFNQIASHIPSTAVIKSLAVEVNTASTSKDKTTPIGTIAKGSAEVVLRGAAAFSQFAQVMGGDSVPGMSVTPLTGLIVATGSTTVFPMNFSLTKAMHDQRLNIFDQKVP
jgi:type IV pilus assembly protein PilM